MFITKPHWFHSNHPHPIAQIHLRRYFFNGGYVLGRRDAFSHRVVVCIVWSDCVCCRACMRLV